MGSILLSASDKSPSTVDFCGICNIFIYLNINYLVMISRPIVLQSSDSNMTL